ncbi:MAG: hypothetical protein IT373_01755 [Polyangiaceae bacterium]|nr:hypothetical protein [Polyangiaceae bacterium]
MPSTPLWKLRRLAPRARRVAERRASESPALAAFAPSLIGKVGAFVAAYDAFGKYDAPWRKEMSEGHGAAATLVKTMRAWLPALIRDVPGFRGGDYGDQPEVPDDVIGDGERLLEVLAAATTQSGDPVAYRDSALAHVEPAVQRAQKEWQEAEAADRTYQSMAATTRDTAAAFQEELILFRRTLMSVAGRSDKDYQKLRAGKATATDDEDDPNAPPVPAPVEPGPPPPVV